MFVLVWLLCADTAEVDEDLPDGQEAGDDDVSSDDQETEVEEAGHLGDKSGAC